MRKVWLTTRVLALQRFKKVHSSQDGFSLIEVLLAAVIFAFLVAGLIGAIIYGRSATASAGDRVRALQIADEGIQAVKNIRDASYANLVNGTYGLSKATGQWAFSGTSDVNGIYTRQIVIATGGTNREAVTSTVTWTQANGSTGTVSLTDQLANWSANIKLWSNAILAGSTAITGAHPALKVRTQGNYAYTVVSIAGAANFVVTNISNPAAPTIVSAITLPSSEVPTNIFVSGTKAYVTCTHATAELVILDITNPAAPTQVGSYTPTGTADGKAIFVSGTTAYFGRTSNSGVAELSILNVSNPAAPTVIGSYGPNVTIFQVFVSGNYAYLATSATNKGLIVVNITNPAAPVLASAFQLPNVLGGAIVTGFGSTVLVGSAAALYAINVATPTAPSVTGTFTAASTINDADVDITNKYAFVANIGSTGFQVVNIANLAAMALTKTVTTTSGINGVSYDISLDVVAGASASTTLESVVFTRN
jgi:prepilin-type N-terminal cleavage/methylation domain-containing protein